MPATLFMPSKVQGGVCRMERGAAKRQSCCDRIPDQALRILSGGRVGALVGP